MKTKIALVLTVGLLVLQINVKAQQAFKIKTAAITVQGTSTLHEWESTAETIECKGVYLVDNNALTDIPNAEVKILVEGIKSTKGKMMDNKTYEAFKYEKYPYITFSLTSKKIEPAKGMIEVKGNLTMAGVTKVIEIPVKYKVLPNGDLQVKASKNLKMNDYKMEPPTAMMGTIKVGDEVTVHFDLTLTPNKIIQ